MYQCVNGDTLSYLKCLLRFKESGRSLRSNNDFMLDKPLNATSIGQRAFIIAAPTLWNNLPKELKVTPTVNLFNIRHKQYLLKKY